jgi:AcrR family transcriptional regulator
MNEADRRVKRSRKLLQEAFRELLGEKGFDAITVQDVAERAEVNRGTFYAHFPDKYALLEQVIGESFREALLNRVPVGAPFTGENLELLAVAVLEFLGEFSSHCRPSDRELAPLVETSMWRELHNRLLEWLEGTPGCSEEPAVAPETAATVMSWAIFGTGLDWSRGSRADTAEARARQILRLLTGGLAHLGRLPAETPAPQLAAHR